MIYTKQEMQDLLIETVGVSEEAIDLAVKLLGDTPQTYIKILNAASEYSTFSDVEDALFSDEYV